MRRIDTKIDPSSENYRSNFKHHKNISDDLGNVLNNVRKMGPSDRIEKHQKRGKLTVRERIDRLCLLYTSPSPRDATLSRMPSSA